MTWSPDALLLLLNPQPSSKTNTCQAGRCISAALISVNGCLFRLRMLWFCRRSGAPWETSLVWPAEWSGCPCHDHFGPTTKYILTDEPLTPNIDKVMAVWIFRKKALKTKIGNLDFLILIYIYFSAHTRGNLLKFLQGTVSERSRPLENLVKNGPSVAEKINHPTWYSPFPSQIWPNALYVGSLRTKKTYIWPYEAPMSYIKVQCMALDHF